MDTIGEVYQSLGIYDRATPLLQNALSTRQHVLGKQDPDVAASLQHLGLLAFLKGDRIAAEQLLRESLGMRRKLLGNEHMDVTLSLSDLAMVLRYKETPAAEDEAERYYRRGAGNAPEAARWG